MKKICFLFGILLALIAIQPSKAQGTADVPVVGGRVVFSDTIETLLDKKAIRLKLNSWLEEYSSDKVSRVVSVNDTTLNALQCTFIDYLEMGKASLFIYAIYVKYTVRILYTDNRCTVRINRIEYITPEDFNSEDRFPPVHTIPAEDVFIKNNYKVGLVPDAPQKIKFHTLVAVEKLFRSLRTSFE